MHRRIILFGSALVLVLAACATATTIDDEDSGTGTEGGIDGAACPQYDLLSDPKHCGSCTKSCNVDQVCSMGACKSMCDVPLTKCVTDGGAACVDFKSDPAHCGNCSTKCTVSDGGGIPSGTNNPDPGIFPDGGYDGGPGWVVGMAGCTNGNCSMACPMGFTGCTDVCYDTKNHHENCGMCGTSCAQNEWCTQGNCCAVGSQWCSTACTDVTSDPNNCGACGNKCPNNMPTCQGAKCSNAYTYSKAFVANQTPTQQCTDWKAYIAGLGNNYTAVTISGTNDMTGYTCNVPSIVNNLAQALKNVTSYGAMCNGHYWSNCNRYNDELWVDAPSLCDTGNCPNPGYMMRICFGGSFFGGIKTATCPPPSQTMTLSFY